MNERTKVIYVATGLDEAEALKQFLTERGFQVFIENVPLQVASGTLAAGAGTSPRLRVAENAWDAAKAAVAEFERERLSSDNDALDEDEEEITIWADWPTCPTCERPRQAVCPICKVAGSDFPLAEFNPALSERGPTKELPLLLCQTCDEAFEPRFYRSCAWCGYEFARGIEPPAVKPAVPEFSSMRIWVMFAAVLAFCLAAVAYFWRLGWLS